MGGGGSLSITRHMQTHTDNTSRALRTRLKTEPEQGSLIQGVVLVGDADLEVVVAAVALTDFPLAVAAVPVGALSRRVVIVDELQQQRAASLHLVPRKQERESEVNHSSFLACAWCEFWLAPTGAPV